MNLSFIQTIKKYKTITALIGVSSIIFLANLIIVYFSLDQLSYPLVFNFSTGEEARLTGSAADFRNLLIMEALFLSLNSALALYLYYRQRVLTYFILASNVLIALLSIVISAHIISFN